MHLLLQINIISLWFLFGFWVFSPEVSSHLLFCKHIMRHTSILMEYNYFGDSKVWLHKGWFTIHQRKVLINENCSSIKSERNAKRHFFTCVFSPEWLAFGQLWYCPVASLFKQKMKMIK